MTAKHTPGPWTAGEVVSSRRGEHSAEVYAAGYQHIVTVVEGTRVRCLADARLIAAAPDLLGFARLVAALEDKCRSEGGRHPTYAEWAVLATSIPALARATGGDK